MAISPDGVVISSDKPSGTGFEFDRLGVRIPAVVISAYQIMIGTAKRLGLTREQ